MVFPASAAEPRWAGRLRTEYRYSNGGWRESIAVDLRERRSLGVRGARTTHSELAEAIEKARSRSGLRHRGGDGLSTIGCWLWIVVGRSYREVSESEKGAAGFPTL